MRVEGVAAGARRVTAAGAVILTLLLCLWAVSAGGLVFLVLVIYRLTDAVTSYRRELREFMLGDTATARFRRIEFK